MNPRKAQNLRTPPKQLVLIPGDGIGREVVPAAAEVLTVLLPGIELIEAEAGWSCFEQRGSSVPQETLLAVRAAGAALFGAVQSPSRRVEGYRSAILTLRQALGLYANLRPVRAFDGSVDLVVIRENSEGLYIGEERSINADTAEATRRITRQASARIGRVAATVAQRRQRRVAIVHKANVLPLTGGLFRDSVRAAIAEVDRGAEVEELLVDIAAYHLAGNPGRFDVIVTTNLFGDILSDLAAVHGGGIGVAASLNIGDGVALAEPVHGSAPDIAGKKIANPVATLLSVALLLRHHWREVVLADRLEAACRRAMREAPTPDLGGVATTWEFTGAVLACLAH